MQAYVHLRVLLVLVYSYFALARKQLPPVLPEDLAPNASPRPSPPAFVERTILATGNGSIQVASPPLEPAGYVALIQHFNPTSGIKEAKQFGVLDGFTPVELPIIFHLMSFSSNGTTLPAYQDFGNATALQLVADANYFYRGTNIKFRLQEARWDTTTYPYLLFPNLFEWQNCLALTCIASLARAHTVEHVINVFISASNEQFTCPDDAVACSSFQSSGYTAMSPGSGNTNTTQQQEQGGVAGVNFMWLNYDRFDPTFRFNAQSLNNTGESGASVLAHELAHYLGLLHTFQGGCQAPINDGVPDTAPNLDFGNPALPWNISKAVAWCDAFRKGLNPSIEELSAFKSCPGTPGMDNVFNLMSYIPGSCCMVFTENQVARMQWAILTYMPDWLQRFSTRTNRLFAAP